MMGLVLKLLVDLVETQVSEDKVSEIFRKADIPQDRKYQLDKIYSDEEWQRLFKIACESLQISQEQAEKAYADFFMKDAMTRWPVWFKMSKSAREFIMRQPAIHNSLVSSVQNKDQRRAVNDKFQIQEKDNKIIVSYASSNHLCGLFKELALWLMDHYGDHASIQEESCQKEGHPSCEINIIWDN